MAVPASRDEFKNYCLRALGAPVLQINVQDSDDFQNQIDDRIDDALNFFADFHYDGTEVQYYAYALTQTDIDNTYITLPDNFIGAVRIFKIDMGMSTNNIFSLHYQIMLNDLHQLTSVSMVPYYMAMQRLEFLEDMLVGEKPIRYNRLNNKLHIDMSWDGVNPGVIIMVEAYSVIDQTTCTKLWGDRWLQKYAVALLKQQWGQNTSKYGVVQLPGGATFNGKQLHDEATIEVERLEKQLKSDYVAPLGVFVG
jgi:hypothetical protein